MPTVVVIIMDYGAKRGSEQVERCSRFNGTASDPGKATTEHETLYNTIIFSSKRISVWSLPYVLILCKAGHASAIHFFYFFFFLSNPVKSKSK